MIIKCKECGHDVSTEAAACPSCGYPQQPTPAVAESNTATTKRKSHMYGWIALIAFLMTNFIPAILAPLVVLAAFAFAVSEINQGSKTFGGIIFVLCALQAWFIADHFGGLSGSLGITNPKQIEETTARKYSATNLNVPSDADQTIEQKCAEEWPRDFRMRAYCEGQQYDSYHALQSATMNESQRGACAQKWPNDYRMRQHCERKP